MQFRRHGYESLSSGSGARMNRSFALYYHYLSEALVVLLIDAWPQMGCPDSLP